MLSVVESQCYHKSPSKFRQFLQLHFEARSMAVDLSQDLVSFFSPNLSRKNLSYLCWVLRIT